MTTDVFDLSGVEERVMRTRTQFDMEPWKQFSSLLKFTSVQWDAGYDHVVDWPDEETRNDWFRDREGWVQEIPTGWNFKNLEVWKPGLNRHQGVVRVSIPFEEIMEYNYLYVEMGEQPVPGGPVKRRENFFYFITSLNKISPNVSELWLELDSWTTYRPSITIEGFNLLRGHLPHALTSADEFLSNPLENHFGLTEIEPDLPTAKPLVSNQDLVSFQSEGPLVCIATTADFSSPSSFWVSAANTNAITNPSSVSTPSDNWVERPINSGGSSAVGNNGVSAKTAVGSRTSVSGSFYVYAMTPAAYASFIVSLRKRLPQAVKTIKAVYLLDSSLIERGNSFVFNGQSMRPVILQTEAKLLKSVVFDNSQFGFDPIYEDFAKLYTRQFSVVEVTNLNGSKIHISVEDVAESLDFYSRASTAFPFLKLEAFMNGIGGRERKTYAVKPWTNENAELFKSSWEESILELDVPTYGVFAESREIEGVLNQIERYRMLREANLRKLISDIENQARRSIRTAELTKDIDNARRTYTAEFLNATALTGLARTNDLRTISAELFARTKEIALSYNNDIDSITRNLQNATNQLDNNFGNALNAASTDFNNSNRSIARIRTVSLNDAGASLGIANSNTFTELSNSGDSNVLQNSELPTVLRNANAIQYFTRQGLLGTVAQWNRNLSRFNAIVDVDEMDRLANVGVLTSGAAGLSGVVNGASAIAGGAATAINLLSKAAIFNVKTNSLERRYEANSNPSEFNASITLRNPGFWNQIFGGDGASFVFNNVKSSLLIELEERLRNLQIDYSREDFVIRRSAELSTQFNNFIIQRTATNSFSVANITYDASVFAANSAFSSESANTADTYNRSVQIATAVRNVARTITNRDFSTDTTIAVRRRNEMTAVMNNDIARSTDNVQGTFSVRTTVNTRNRDTAKLNTDASDTTGRQVISIDFNTAASNILRQYNADISDLTAAYSRMIFDEPLQYGDSDGSAWLDAWGQRGINVIVKRISKPSERVVGKTFLMKGYRTSPTWVDSPNLSLMTLFTYWQANDVRINALPINETNKEIFRRVFEHGVTVWRDPDLVNTDVDITNNRTEGIL